MKNTTHPKPEITAGNGNPYKAPTLSVYGSIAALTHTSSPNTGRGDQGANSMAKTH
jgi:hypothetical protein